MPKKFPPGRPPTHGHWKNGKASPTYKSWESMIARCNNENTEAYKYYGARGIKVCERWMDFETFLMDMGERPNGMTIDRIKNHLGYFKENCKWSTVEEQAATRNPPKGERSGTARLTNSQAIEIRTSDLSGKKLAVMFGVSTSTISAIKTGKTYNV